MRSHATDESQGRSGETGEDESRTEDRDESGGETEAKDGREAETREEKRAETRAESGLQRSREKLAQFRAMNVKMHEPELALSARGNDFHVSKACA